MCLYAAEKYEKVESINTQNDYETASKKWSDKKKQTCSLCFVNVFKSQENKFKIVQQNLLEIKIIPIKKKEFLKKLP